MKKNKGYKLEQETLKDIFGVDFLKERNKKIVDHKVYVDSITGEIASKNKKGLSQYTVYEIYDTIGVNDNGFDLHHRGVIFLGVGKSGDCKHEVYMYIYSISNPQGQNWETCHILGNKYELLSFLYYAPCGTFCDSMLQSIYEILLKKDEITGTEQKEDRSESQYYRMKAPVFLAIKFDKRSLIPISTYLWNCAWVPFKDLRDTRHEDGSITVKGKGKNIKIYDGDYVTISPEGAIVTIKSEEFEAVYERYTHRNSKADWYNTHNTEYVDKRFRTWRASRNYNTDI